MITPLLSGEVEYIEEQGPSEIEMLRAQVTEMQEELNTVKGVLLRMYGAFKASFGDQAIVTTESSGKWDAIKQRMAPRLKDCIELLQLQGSMGRKQIAAALHLGYDNCTTNVVGVLLRQGWLVESGGKLSLKQL